MTCREEILKCLERVPQFTMKEALKKMEDRGSVYSESTIRTHIASYMCGNSPTNHGTVHGDFMRIGRGVYVNLSTDV